MLRLIDELSIQVVPVTRAGAVGAANAYARWGKGRHPAALNFGDCLSYALAAERGCPLLYVGNDFARTDVARVETNSRSYKSVGAPPSSIRLATKASSSSRIAGSIGGASYSASRRRARMSERVRASGEPASCQLSKFRQSETIGEKNAVLKRYWVWAVPKKWPPGPTSRIASSARVLSSTTSGVRNSASMPMVSASITIFS